LLKTFKERHINELETLNHKIRAKIWRQALRSGKNLVGARSTLVIDVDSTVKTAYGSQEGVEKGYNPHKQGASSYHPLLAFCAETKEILQGWLRCGTAHTSNGWEQCTFYHRCATWSRAWLFMAVRTEKPAKPNGEPTLFEMKQYDHFCYVVTDCQNPWQAHKQYGQRATCETWIEEAKNQTALAQIKTDDFLANSALFQSAILAYNTLRWMALLSGDAVLRRWEPSTLRTFIIRMAAKITTGSRQQRLYVPERMLYATQWDAWVALGER